MNALDDTQTYKHSELTTLLDVYEPSFSVSVLEDNIEFQQLILHPWELQNSPASTLGPLTLMFQEAGLSNPFFYNIGLKDGL